MAREFAISSVGYVPDFTASTANGISYLAWSRPSNIDPPGSRIIAAQIAIWSVRLTGTSTGRIEFALSGTGGFSTIEIDAASYRVANQWLFTGISTGIATGQHSIFIGNATAPASKSIWNFNVGTLRTNSGSLFIGASNHANGQFYQGAIGMIMCYDRELTDEEMWSLQFDPRPLSGCIGYWLPGYHGGSTDADFSGNGKTVIYQNANGVTSGSMPIYVKL